MEVLLVLAATVGMVLFVLFLTRFDVLWETSIETAAKCSALEKRVAELEKARASQNGRVNHPV